MHSCNTIYPSLPPVGKDSVWGGGWLGLGDGVGFVDCRV